MSGGDTLFTLIGFVGLYFVFGLLFLYLVGREIARGPDQEPMAKPSAERQETVLVTCRRVNITSPAYI